MKLFRYHHDFGRMGSLSGTFAVTDRGLQWMQELHNRKARCYFGECLGKHSDVSHPFSMDDLEEIKATEKEIQLVFRVFEQDLPDPETQRYALLAGYCPLDGLSEAEQQTLMTLLLKVRSNLSSR